MRSRRCAARSGRAACAAGSAYPSTHIDVVLGLFAVRGVRRWCRSVSAARGASACRSGVLAGGPSAWLRARRSGSGWKKNRPQNPRTHEATEPPRRCAVFPDSRGGSNGVSSAGSPAPLRTRVFAPCLCCKQILFTIINDRGYAGAQICSCLYRRSIPQPLRYLLLLSLIKRKVC